MHEFKKVLPKNNYIEAGNPQTAPERLAELASAPEAKVRKRVAENSLTPLSILLAMVEDENSDVRSAVAENPKFPADFLWMFVYDPSVDVRYSIAENYNMSGGLLGLLSVDENPYVSERAKKTLAKRSRLLRFAPIAA